MIHLFEAVRLGIGYGFLISALAIGPSFFMVLQTSIQRGLKMAIALELGIILSDIVCIFFAYLGAASLMSTLEESQYTYPSAGAVLIVYGLLKFLREKKPVKPVKTAEGQNALVIFLRGFFINIINPGLLLYWFTIVGLGFEALKDDGITDQQLVQANVLFNATIIGVVFGIDLLKIFFAQKLRNVLKDEVLEKIDIVVSCIFIGMGLYFVFKNFI